MSTIIHLADKAESQVKVMILRVEDDLKSCNLSLAEENYVHRMMDDNPYVVIWHPDSVSVVVSAIEDKESATRYQKLRRAGARVLKYLNSQHYESFYVESFLGDESETLAFCEGAVMANYQFLKYKSSPDYNTVCDVYLRHSDASVEGVTRLNTLMDAVCWARDLVNEPVNHLDAQQFAMLMSAKVREAGAKTEVFGGDKINALKMGGLLAVNAGSSVEPSFTIMEWQPENPVNERPIVLIGKGIVYDTGGYSLKTGANMDTMKHDMAGGAAVAATLYAVAKSQMPIHVIALVPATDNRIGDGARVPDDVITMFDGTTVEVKNTDAEGRLILADALSYAKKYSPEMVFDFATLTGAAKVAIGAYGSVVMGNIDDDRYELLERSGNETYERLVRFPLWTEYGESLKSEVADIKNIGAGGAGAITAGKFLEHFVDYPWMHFDIAGTAFSDKSHDEICAGGTGVGVRLMMHFFSLLCQNTDPTMI